MNISTIKAQTEVFSKCFSLHLFRTPVQHSKILQILGEKKNRNWKEQHYVRNLFKYWLWELILQIKNVFMLWPSDATLGIYLMNRPAYIQNLFLSKVNDGRLGFKSKELKITQKSIIRTTYRVQHEKGFQNKGVKWRDIIQSVEISIV